MSTVSQKKEIQNLEQSLLSGMKESEISSATVPVKSKVDTFNKVALKKNINNKDTSKDSQEFINIMNKSKKTKDTYTNKLNKEAQTREDEMQYVVVKEGDTLFYIAKRIYGDAMLYTVIFEANPDILNDPARISIGQKLRVPKITTAI